MDSTKRDEVFEQESGYSISPEAKAEQKDGAWYNALGLESTEEHRHVAKGWQEKCVPFDEFVDKQSERQQYKYDEERWIRDLEFKDGYLSTGEKLTDNALGHLCGFLDIPPYFVEKLISSGKEIRTELASEIINKLIQDEGKYKNRQMILRMRDDGKPIVCRAIVSTHYGFISNADVSQMLWDALPEEGRSNALASYLYDSGDMILGSVLLPDMMKNYPDSEYGVGISFINSEDKSRELHTNPFLFRSICSNGCQYGRRDMRKGVLSSIKKRHIGEIDLDTLKKTISSIVAVALSEGEDLFRIMGITQNVKIKNPEAIIASLTIENKLTKKEGKAWYGGYKEEPLETAFGIVNGLTRAAQHYEGEEREKMEIMAGQIISPNIQSSLERIEKRWSTTNAKALQLFEDNPSKVYSYVGVEK
tara:strand:- start:127 stop:1383 length:1257 start_codon:yes stop_codon:yes gene_type:complete